MAKRLKQYGKNCLKKQSWRSKLFRRINNIQNYCYINGSEEWGQKARLSPCKEGLKIKCAEIVYCAPEYPQRPCQNCIRANRLLDNLFSQWRSEERRVGKE